MNLINKYSKFLREFVPLFHWPDQEHYFGPCAVLRIVAKGLTNERITGRILMK